jgi:outer membrane protein assembly factor BamB
MRAALRVAMVSAGLVGASACGNSQITEANSGGNAAIGIADPCPRSAALTPGPSDGPLYFTVAPFEHHDGLRSHLFKHSCSLQELAGGSDIRIVDRDTPDSYLTPFNAATRNRDEILLHGFGAKAGEPIGGYVAMIDAETLQQRWRTPLYDNEPAYQWSWPGMVTAHGNGYVYADYGNRFYKLDPDTGPILAEQILPENPNGAVYNGFAVLPDGRMVTKNMESPLCPVALANMLIPYSLANELLGRAVGIELFGGLACHLLLNTLPSTMVILDPERLDIVAVEVLPEPMAGRVSVRSHDGHTYIYIPGSTNLYRYEYTGNGVALDQDWGPVPYVESGQGPAAAASFIDDFVILHNTGYLRAGSLFAVNIRDSSQQFRINPFELLPGVPLGPSFVLSQQSTDDDNNVVVALDTFALKIGAIHFDPETGFDVLWTRPTLSIAYSALIGPSEQRQIMVPDQLNLGPLTGDPLGSILQDRVLWLDLMTGAEVASSVPLDILPAPGNIVSPGFSGRFYYPGASGKLTELSVERAAAVPAP